MALVNIGEDSWLNECDNVERLAREIQTQLSQRNSSKPGSDPYNKASATIRIRLKQFNQELTDLNKKLKSLSRTRSLTADETERRQRQIEYLQSKSIQLGDQFKNVPGSADRASLMGTSKMQKSSLWDGDDEDDEPLNDNFSVEQIKEQQNRLIEQQNSGLDSLSKVISRQRELAMRIGEEVDVHHDILDNLAGSVDNTHVRIEAETQHVGLVTQKDKTCGYWIIIISLFVAICVIGLI